MTSWFGSEGSGATGNMLKRQWNHMLGTADSGTVISRVKRAGTQPLGGANDSFWSKVLYGGSSSIVLLICPTYPKVSEQWCVGVSQHGVAGTQSLHVHVGGEARGRWVGQSRSWAVLLVVVRHRPVCRRRLQDAAANRGRSFPAGTLQHSFTGGDQRLSSGASNIRAKAG